MSLNSNTAQTRELGELRNHLKWLDEERRKSARKMTELEQRLAQQGREVAERDQKIKELEWHIASFAERLERVPETDPNTAAQEQRLQDLEWHLSNIGAQLAKLPNLDEERARMQGQIDQALDATQQRVLSDQGAAEARLMAEVAALREAESRLALNFQVLEESLPSAMRLEDRLQPLAVQQDAQAQSLAQVNETIATLHEDLGQLANQLRDRTVTLAAESQTNFTSLAARFQEHLDAQSASVQEHLNALAEQYETRTTIMATEWQDSLNAIANRGPEISPEFLRFGEQLDEVQSSVQLVPSLAVQLAQLEQHVGEIDALREEVSQMSSQWHESLSTTAAESQTGLSSLAATFQERLDGLAATSQERLDGLAAEWRDRLDAVADRGPDLSPELQRLGEQLPSLAAQLAHVERRTGEIDTLLKPLTSAQADLAGAVATLPALSAQVADLDQRLTAVPDVTGQIARLEDSVAKLANVREMLPLFGRLEQEMELRQAEEVRLANLIGSQEGRFVPLATGLEELRENNLNLISRLSDAERLIEEARRTTLDFNDNWKPALTEVSRRIGPLTERLTVLNNSVLKSEASLQALGGDHAEMRETVINLAEDVRRSRTESARQLDAWQTTIDEHKDTIERFTQQWLTLSNQYKEARMAVQNFAHWQKQLEQQKRESSEMLRIESNRMQGRWDGLLIEIQEKLKNFELELGQKWQSFELENEQKWAGARRSEQMWREELGAVDELIQKLQQDNRTLIWRVQAAQADAIKKWPRLLMEEVEKAVELNPNRRLSSSGAAPRAEMSVVDAIEQGLIKIDYNDDAGLDL